MTSFLVSNPEPRLLVATTEQDNRETTLVVPTLKRREVSYFKCLVDEGIRFAEHAVVWWEGEPPSSAEGHAIEQALGAARPTEVTICGSDMPPRRADGSVCTHAGRAAVAVVAGRLQLETATVFRAWGVRVERQGQFFACFPDEKPSPGTTS